jgi:hypothetical protein
MTITLRPAHLLLTAPFFLGSCDYVDLATDEDGLVIEFKSEPLPLLPNGFPVYPKAFSTSSLDGLVGETIEQLSFQAGIDDVASTICVNLGITNVCLDDVIQNDDYALIDQAIENNVPELTDWAEEHLIGQLRFFNAQPLGVGVNEQIGRIFQGKVEFTDVKLHMTVRNRTDGVWGVPIKFKMFMGSGESVSNKTALITSSESEDYTLYLAPGESKTITTDNMLSLVDALNEVKSLALDYEADIEVADIDPASFDQWLQLSRSKDEDGNGIADDLAGWGLVFEDFRLEISGEGHVDIPIDVPEWLLDFVP